MRATPARLRGSEGAGGLGPGPPQRTGKHLGRTVRQKTVILGRTLRRNSPSRMLVTITVPDSKKG